MIAAVFSDTHSNTALMLDAIFRFHPDVVIHLGDHDRDCDEVRLEYPQIPLYSVRGNCDFATDAPLFDIVPLGPVKAYITHGHQYNVKWGDFSSLAYAAMEQGAQIVMFGHTHEAINENLGGITLINPGTAGKGHDLTFALVEVFDNGGISCQIKKL